MAPRNAFGLPPTVAAVILPLAADVIEQAASLGPGRWGLTSYAPYVRINVGWTEILTTSDDHLRLIVDGTLARNSKIPPGVTLVQGDNGGDYYPSVPGSVLAEVPYRLRGNMAAVIEALRPALARAVSLAGQRRGSRGVKAGHNQVVVEQLAAATGRSLPAPGFQVSESELEEGLSFMEGALTRVVGNRFERSAEARRACIAHYGTECVVCGFSFERQYGPFGRGFIHVHHLAMVSRGPEEHVVDPVADLRPVCPNCHAMLHRDEPPLTIESLRQLRRGGGDA